MFSYCIYDMDSYKEDLISHICDNSKCLECNNPFDSETEWNLVLDRSGSVVVIKNLLSSGNNDMDKLVERELLGFFPFRPFPENSIDPYLDMVLPIKLKVRK